MSIARIAFRFTMERSSERGNQTAVVTTYRVEGSLAIISPYPEGTEVQGPECAFTCLQARELRLSELGFRIDCLLFATQELLHQQRSPGDEPGNCHSGEDLSEREVATCQFSDKKRAGNAAEASKRHHPRHPCCSSLSGIKGSCERRQRGLCRVEQYTGYEHQRREK